MMTRDIFGYVPFLPTCQRVSSSQHFSFWFVYEDSVEGECQKIPVYKKIVNKAALLVYPYQ